jgi:arginase family enzyme
MEISVYLEPVRCDHFDFNDPGNHNRMGEFITLYAEKDHFPDLTGTEIALLGVDEDRYAVNNPGCAQAPDAVRKYFYNLFRGNFNVKIADLGNIRRGHSVEDTYFALASVASDLIRNDIIPVIIGGSQDLTFANYRAYEMLGQIINIVALDPLFDLGKTDQEMSSQSYLSKIILHQPNYLFNYTNVGYQTYFVDQDAVELMKNLYFDVYRLGKVRENLEEAEPIVRNADMVSVDISCIRQSDAPGNGNASPNGFYGEEMCRIVRYAGLSDKLSSIGFYEINPGLDPSDQTSHLVAQMMWFFIDGYYNRKHDLPHKDKKGYLKYTVSLKNHKDQLVFYKSKKSDRWWMDVPVKAGFRSLYERHHLVPCSYNDYEIACKDDVPDRWWQTYQKLM